MTSSAEIPRFRAATTLMVQGTTSDAGKSALVTALCRLHARLGRRVAPFKPQNMALNSAVAEDGGEIGRAQAVQAQAAGVPALTAFNPILLKPNSDIGAQLIVRGRAIGHYRARAYQALKPRLLETVVELHGELARDYDLVLVEGAGSPAEINLRAGDIANMGFAEAVDCAVILVSDIDRGGVFAHLVGTLELLSDTERERIRGFVINRFRGDPALLEAGLEWLEARTGKPVLAVLPYLEEFHLEAEDGLSRGGDTQRGEFRVVVATPPRLSNVTDFDPLRLHPNVSLRFAKRPEQAGPADLVILPGSKNTRADLAWLRARGWQAHLERHLRYGGKVLGVCGGYQMLGGEIDDPDGVEGAAGSSPGFGLLEHATRLSADKTLRRVTGTSLFGAGTARVEGYEIHVGESGEHPAAGGSRAAFQLEDGRLEGRRSPDDQVLGSYLHGLFDHPEALAALLAWAGLEQPEPFDYRAQRDAEIDRLADALAASLRPACLAEPLLTPLYSSAQDDGAQGSRKLP